MARSKFTKTKSASTGKSKKLIYFKIADDNPSPHHPEFDPATVDYGGIPYAVSVTQRSDGSMVVARGTLVEDVSPPAVQFIQDNGLYKLRDRFIDDLQNMGPRELELWISKHLLA